MGIRDLYKKIDLRFRGYLPGGVTPAEAKAKLIPKVKPVFKVPEYAYTPGAAPPTPKVVVTKVDEKVIVTPIVVTPKPGPVEKAIEKVQKAQRAATELIRPSVKEGREAIERLDRYHTESIKVYNRNVANFEKEVKTFSKVYGEGKKLSQAQRDLAIKQQQGLEAKRKRLEASERILTHEYVQERAQLEYTYGTVVRKKVPTPIRLAQSLWVGLISAPLGVATIGLGLVSKPEETIKGVARGVKELPKAVVTKPIETIGEIAGQAAFFYLGGAAVGALKVKPKLSQSISASKANYIGKDALGRNMYSTEAKVVTLLKHPKTGKTLQILRTETISKSVVSSTKAGALKSITDTTAATLRNQAIRLGAKPTIVKKYSLSKAKSEMTINPADVAKISKGYGPTAIQDIGKIKVFEPIGKPPKIIKAKVKLKPGVKTEALTDIWIKQIGTKPKLVKITPTKALLGKEYLYKYKALSDIYGVKGAKQILRAQEVGGARVFVPEYIGVKYPKGIVVKKLPTYRLPANIGDILGGPSVVQVTKVVPKVVTKKTAAQISAETSAKLLGRVAAPKVVPRFLPLSRTIQLLSPVTAVVTIPKVKAVAKPKVVSVPKIKEIKIPGLTTAIKPVVITKIKPRIRLTPRVKARLKQPQKVIQLLSPMVITKPKQRYVSATKLAQGINQALRQQVAVVQAPKAVQVPRAPMITPPVTPIPIPTIILPPYAIKETKAQKRKRKIEEAKLKAQQRAYQASVGAVVLGITAPKIPKKKFTGLGLRPVISKRRPKKQKKSNYLKRIEKAFR